MEPSEKLWKNVFNSDPPKIKKELKEKNRIIACLKESFITTWPNMYWSDYQLGRKDKGLIKNLIRDYFNEMNHFDHFQNQLMSLN